MTTCYCCTASTARLARFAHADYVFLDYVFLKVLSSKRWQYDTLLFDHSDCVQRWMTIYIIQCLFLIMCNNGFQNDHIVSNNITVLKQNGPKLARQ